MKRLSLAVSMLFVPTLSLADVVNEYREEGSDGYVAATYLLEEASDDMIARGVETYGEYDLTDNWTLTGRATRSLFDPKEEPVVKGHIVSAGVRYNYDLTEKFNVGFKTNVVHREYNEVKGLSYRFMPILQYKATDYLHFRYIYEMDYIPGNSWEDESSTGGRVEQETALYMRVMPMELLEKDYPVKVSYELKASTGVGQQSDGTGNYNMSYEHNLYATYNDRLSFKFSQSEQDGDLGLMTMGVVYSF